MCGLSERFRFGFIGSAVRRVLSVKSARGVSFSLSIIAMASKPLGYLRTLLIAWAFGTSAGMDAFHLASGIVALVAGSIGSAMESAVLPELARLRKDEDGMEKCRSVFALVVLILILISILFSIVVLAAPGVLIRFFAGGFDAERVRMGALMLWWLLPFAVVTICRPALETWALFTERYTVSAVTGVIFNFVAIPVLLALTPFVGSYAVAGCISLGNAITFLLFFFALHGIPFRVRREKLQAESIKRIGHNSLFSLMLISAMSLFFIVDRYFASRLPVGSVAAISYGSQMIGIISLAAFTPLTFFLARTSNMVVKDIEEARRFVKQAISVAFAFFMPVGFFVAASAKPLVSLTLGWGNFGAESIAMTSICLAAYAIGMIFAIVGTVLYRYAQASQRLLAIVALSFFLVLTNGLLDWIFVTRWGLLGLACATSVVQFLSFLLYYKVLIPDSLSAFLRSTRFFEQLVLVSLCASLAWWCERFGIVAQLLATFVIGSAYLLLAERLGLMCGVPEGWHPSALLRYVMGSARSFLKK